VVPVLSRFYGIVVNMYFRDHSPPHFHAKYAEYRVSVEILSGATEGRMPERALALVQEWRRAHVEELLACWTLAQEEKPLPAISPLE
jgi:hypothetical protein